uniref:Homing endonuclease n=1 Tax=Ochrobactrum phage ORM_20 TaxID=2985243 RepID=A0A9N6ZG82_9VIRU|nr:homing endonuclease [Ochrobactrum phage ORM_20]
MSSKTINDKKPYCVYFTVYKGDKLPPFYIGYSTVRKVNYGYNGSASSKKYKEIWEEERKFNRHLFKTKILKTFSTVQEAMDYETELQSHFEVHRSPLFINMAVTSRNFKPKMATLLGVKRSKESRQKQKETIRNRSELEKKIVSENVSKGLKTEKFRLGILKKAEKMRGRKMKPETIERRKEVYATMDYKPIVEKRLRTRAAKTPEQKELERQRRSAAQKARRAADRAARAAAQSQA